MSKVLDLWKGMTGTVLPFAGSAAPTGWLLCHGQAVSRTTYAALFNTIGTTFGAGDGSTTFNLPDLRGRVAAGKDDMGGSAASRLTNSGTGNPGIDGATLGAAGGVDRHQLTEAQMPTHAHNTPAGTISDGAAGWSTIGAAGGGTNVVNISEATSSTGSSNAHPNAQPTIILNQIIKT